MTFWKLLRGCSSISFRLSMDNLPVYLNIWTLFVVTAVRKPVPPLLAVGLNTNTQITMIVSSICHHFPTLFSNYTLPRQSNLLLEGDQWAVRRKTTALLCRNVYYFPLSRRNFLLLFCCAVCALVQVKKKSVIRSVPRCESGKRYVYCVLYKC